MLKRGTLLEGCRKREVQVSNLHTQGELRKVIVLYDTLIAKTKSELYSYLHKLSPSFSSDATRAALIKASVSKPLPGPLTIEKIEKVIMSSASTRKKVLQTYLSIYLWWKDEKLQQRILSHVNIRPIEVPIVKALPKPKIISVPKDSVNKYRIVKITNSGTGAKVRNSITFAELQKEIKSPTFISKMVASIRDLFAFKLKRYASILVDLKKMYASLELRMKRLKEKGMDFSDIKDLYPILPYILSHIVLVEELIELVKVRKAELTPVKVRQNLLDALEDTEEGISSMVGREDIKDMIASQIFSLSFGCFAFTNHFNNMRIYGKPGIGKTYLAKIIGSTFTKLGILVKGDVKCTSRVDFVGSYIGQTAPKTVNLLMETLESVLFVDEAHQLAMKTGTNDYGDEAITEMVNFTDKFIGLSIIIVAGYREQMVEYFMPSNKGLYRRFPYMYSLEPYNVGELTDILIKMLKKDMETSTTLTRDQSSSKTIDIDAPVCAFLSEIIKTLEPHLGDQAGDMLNLSGCIGRAIGSAYKVRWKNHNLEQNIPILLEGINSFLATKGVVITG